MSQLFDRNCVRRAKRLYLALAGASLLAPAQNAIAAFDLSWQPQLRLGTRATDNLRTAIDDPEAAWGFDLGGGVALNLESNTVKSRITPGFNFRRFAIGEGADADEYDVRTSTQWNFADRVTASLDFDYVRDSTLSTELSDAGRQTAVANRDTIYVAPGIGIALTDRTTFNVGLLYSDVQFEQLPGAPLSDYDFKQINGSVSHLLTERLSLFSNAYVSEFRASSSSGKSLTYGGLGGARYSYSPALVGEFSLGFVQSEIDVLSQQIVPDQFQIVLDQATGQLRVVPVVALVEQTIIENGPIARVNIQKQWSDRTDMDFAYSRSVTPTVFGAQSASDDILLEVRHQFTRRIFAEFRGGYNMRSAETDQELGSRVNLNRSQVLLLGAVRYRLSEVISVGATYRFVYNDFEDLSQSSSNNGFFLTFVYNGRPHFYRGF